MEQHYFGLGASVGIFLVFLASALIGEYGASVCKETLKASDCHLEWVAGPEISK